MKVGTIYWNRLELDLHARKVAEILLARGYPADGWEPAKSSKTEGARMRALFDEAQKAVLPKERWRIYQGDRGGTRSGFTGYWQRSVKAVNRIIGKMAKAQDKAKEHEARIQNQNLPPTPEPVPVAPEPPKAEPQAEEILNPGAAQEYVMALLEKFPTGLLLEKVLDRMVAKLGQGTGGSAAGQKIEVGISADVAKNLDELTKAWVSSIEENHQLKVRVTNAEARLNEMAATPANYMSRVKRVVFIGRHQSQFRKVQEDIKVYNFPIEFRWIDADRSPTEIFADYAICTSECSHAWTGKVKESVAPGRWIMGNTNSEKVRDQIKIWLTQEN